MRVLEASWLKGEVAVVTAGARALGYDMADFLRSAGTVGILSHELRQR